MRKSKPIRTPWSFLKHVVVAGLGGLAGIFGGIIGVGMYIVHKLTSPKSPVPYSNYTFSPFELALPAEEVFFPPLQGKHKVSGWYVPAPGATTTIVISPGYRGSRTDVLGICTLLWRAGHNILVFEYYGHGQVVGTPITLGYREINDFLGAVLYAKQRAPHTRLGAVGYSMGAAVTIMGSARAPDIEAVVADSAFATHRSAIEFAVRQTLHLPFFIFEWITDVLLWWRAGYRLNQVEPLRDIGRIAPRPILLIHGTSDTVVDPHDATLLYQAAKEPKELWLLPNVEHCGAYFLDRLMYTQRVIQFFERTLKKPGPQMAQPIPTEPSSSRISGDPSLPEAS